MNTEQTIRFIVITLGYWGRGETIHAAAEACRKAGGKRSNLVFVNMILGDKNPAIDSDGSMVYSEGADYAGTQNHCILGPVKLGGLLPMKERK